MLGKGPDPNENEGNLTEFVTSTPKVDCVGLVVMPNEVIELKFPGEDTSSGGCVGLLRKAPKAELI